eukprot:4267522-Prymnesium_polylepis.1
MGEPAKREPARILIVLFGLAERALCVCIHSLAQNAVRGRGATPRIHRRLWRPQHQTETSLKRLRLVLGTTTARRVQPLPNSVEPVHLLWRGQREESLEKAGPQLHVPLVRNCIQQDAEQQGTHSGVKGIVASRGALPKRTEQAQKTLLGELADGYAVHALAQCLLELEHVCSRFVRSARSCI